MKREEWSVHELGGHTSKCAIWDSDFGVCNCGQTDQKWSNKQNGSPHPDWTDDEVIRRLVTGEVVGRPVSVSEAVAAIPVLVDKGVSVLEMSERMGLDRRRVDAWVRSHLTRAADSW